MESSKAGFKTIIEVVVLQNIPTWCGVYNKILFSFHNFQRP